MSLKCRSSHLSYCTGSGVEKRLMNLILHLVVSAWNHYLFPELRIRLLSAGGGLLLNSNKPVPFEDHSIRNGLETQIQSWLWLRCSWSWDPTWSSCPSEMHLLCLVFEHPFLTSATVLTSSQKSGHDDFFVPHNNIRHESISHSVLVVFLLI